MEIEQLNKRTLIIILKRTPFMNFKAHVTYDMIDGSLHFVTNYDSIYTI